MKTSFTVIKTSLFPHMCKQSWEQQPL